jgi:hypothetical protein
MKKILSTILVIIVAFVLGGCAGADIATLWQKANPKEKAIFLLETYNTQYDQYIDVIAYSTGMTADQIKYLAKADPVMLKEAIDSSTLTEEAKMTLRHKKSILIKLDAPLEEFGRAAMAGLPTSAEQERFILELLNKLKYRAYTK